MNKDNDKSKLTSSISTAVIVALIMIPLTFFSGSLITTLQKTAYIDQLKDEVKSLNEQIKSMSETLKELEITSAQTSANIFFIKEKINEIGGK